MEKQYSYMRPTQHLWKIKTQNKLATYTFHNNDSDDYTFFQPASSRPEDGPL